MAKVSLAAFVVERYGEVGPLNDVGNGDLWAPLVERFYNFSGLRSSASGLVAAT
jgi:hypothetical protein